MFTGLQLALVQDLIDTEKSRSVHTTRMQGVEGPQCRASRWVGQAMWLWHLRRHEKGFSCALWPPVYNIYKLGVLHLSAVYFTVSHLQLDLAQHQ